MEDVELIDDSIRELYQEIILDHGKNPRNYGKINVISHEDKGHNPLCGDSINVYLNVVDNIIKDISFDGRGCAISQASASLMTEIIEGKTIDQVRILFDYFHALCTGDSVEITGNDFEDDVIRLDVLSGVKKYPMRVKCATLSWHTMLSALDNKSIPVI